MSGVSAGFFRATGTGLSASPDRPQPQKVSIKVNVNVDLDVDLDLDLDVHVHVHPTLDLDVNLNLNLNPTVDVDLRRVRRGSIRNAHPTCYPRRHMPLRWLLLDWGDTLMHETGGPPGLPMALWPEVHAIDGAEAVLADLSTRYQIAVATNAKLSDRAQIERALARAALASYVSDVFCYLDLGVPKAEPAFWQAVVARLDVLPSDLLMVGDSLEQDVLGPLRCGIAAVWFNWKRAPIPPEPELHVIDRLADLPDLVDRLSAGDHFVRVT
jgi:putative hydrolase of the HAD superfamily